MRIRTLERSDVREGFSCGEPSLDVFLQRYAWQNQTRHRLGVTYVALDDRTRRVVGYVTLAAGSTSSDAATPRRSGGYADLPVLRIVRLAVDRRFQGVGIGTELVRVALQIALNESERIGCAGVLVDALADSVDFYRRFDFREMRLLVGGSAVRPRLVPMYLEIGAIRWAAE